MAKSKWCITIEHIKIDQYNSSVFIRKFFKLDIGYGVNFDLGVNLNSFAIRPTGTCKVQPLLILLKANACLMVVNITVDQ